MVVDTTALNLPASRAPDPALPRPFYTDPAILGVDPGDRLGGGAALAAE